MDRHAVIAAGQLLMSAIWLEHRVRSASANLSVLARQRAFVFPVGKSLVTQRMRSGSIGASSQVGKHSTTRDPEKGYDP
jgi:hypothetical protein